MALSTVRKAFTAKPSYASDPNAAMLMEMCRKATAKDSFQPDANMKQMVRFDAGSVRRCVARHSLRWQLICACALALGDRAAIACAHSG